jgi:diguanylate cyclase (GGDEF)-like protein
MIFADVRPHLKRTIGFTIATVILFTLLTAYLIHYALNSQEQLYDDVSNKVVQRIQRVKQEQLIENNSDIAWWSDTVNYVLGNNTPWAKRHIGDYLIESLDHDLAAVLGPANTVKYFASSNTALSSEWFAKLLELKLDTILKVARETDAGDPVTQFGFFESDGQLMMIAITLIAPDSEHNWFRNYRYDHVLVTGRIIDALYVRLLGILLDLKDATLTDCSADSATQLVITDPDGTCLRRITWNIAGDKFFHRELFFIFAAYLLLLFGAAFILLRNLYQLTEQFAEHANVDDMTGLYNRRYFNVVASEEMSRFCRDESIGVFVLLDIDNFKKLNDIYGHQAGDEALHKVGKTIKAAFRRTSDYPFRLGGEEFGVILLVREISEVKTATEKLREAIESLGIANTGNPPYDILTVSIGVFISPKGQHKCNLEYAYSMADKALYEAKNKGRNRIEYYENGAD